MIFLRNYISADLPGSPGTLTAKNACWSVINRARPQCPDYMDFVRAGCLYIGCFFWKKLKINAD